MEVVFFNKGTLEEYDTKIIISLIQGAIQKHLEALNSEYNLEECYRILGKKTLEITKHKDKVKSTLREIL